MFRKKKKDKNRSVSYENCPFIKNIKPREGYVFSSDYFKIDNSYASILSFFHTDGASDNFPAFWGVNKIPGGLDSDIVTILFEQSRKRSEDWVEANQKTTERVTNKNETEMDKAGTKRDQKKNDRAQDDLDIIADELADGASYLCVHDRMLVKAPTLEKLDRAIDKIRKLYTDRFKTVTIEAFPGEQRSEITKLWQSVDKKRGKGFHYTSVEYAGSYNLVTNGMSDAKGEFVGVMTGDVNNSAVLFDVDGYDHHIVVANKNFHHGMGRTYLSDVWGSKIGQSTLLNNHKVVHIILDGVDLNTLGPKMENLTAYIDMQNGDVNMFEVFGKVEDELSLFSTNLEKIVLMTKMLYKANANDSAIIDGSLREILTKFYISNRMWVENAQENRSKIRLVGIPHDEVPTLAYFQTYLDTEHKRLLNQTAKDEDAIHAFNVLKLIFKAMLSGSGDLFNKITNTEIDKVVMRPRVIYDLSSLLLRGSGVAMAQLVNIIGYATTNLGEGDTIIVHGVDHIKEEKVKEYMLTQFDYLYRKGGRVAYLYNNIDTMLNDISFNKFDESNYTILGNMSDNILEKYEKTLGKGIPADLGSLITNQGESLCYIRRGHDNVVFRQDLSLGLGLNLKKSKLKLKKGGGSSV